MSDHTFVSPLIDRFWPDGTVALWNWTQARWIRTRNPSMDDLMVVFPIEDRRRLVAWCGCLPSPASYYQQIESQAVSDRLKRLVEQADATAALESRQRAVEARQKELANLPRFA